MDISYNHQEIEKKTQEFWQKKQCFKVTENFTKEKFYSLCMFPYPSGSLHMGHVRNYTLGDIVARYQRALGKNVMQPIGWDAFGLPAENAAIKHKIHPKEWTLKNIESMKEQFLKLGNAYDWSRELATCDPKYYRWEQWIFTKLFEKGLVYKKKSIVNWDPVDKTVLANEQVVDGRGWRSGAIVERKEISQWFIKITAYADELLNDLDKLDDWPEQVKQMQRNWIGRSEGTTICFQINEYHKRLKVYTTRADTLMGCTYLAISPEHKIARLAAQTNEKVKEFIESCANEGTTEAEIATQEKRGIDTGMRAIHPISGEYVPIWVANYVLAQYGSGAVMSVPAHDERDFEFSKKYGLPQKQVIRPANKVEHDFTISAYIDEGTLINSQQFDGEPSSVAKDKITAFLIENNSGKATVNYRLRDWGVSRQRYWGAPIPIIHCDECGMVAVSEENLPVELPEAVNFQETGSPLAQCSQFVETTCPKCGQEAARETDTFDTFVESSWYYARFACKGQDNTMLDDRAKYWTPVDQYIGGIEHAVMHLLYARFFHKLLRDEGMLNSDEPFLSLLSQGMVLKNGFKMSKSKGNTVDPNQIIDTYGADTARFFIIFASPPEQSLEWSDSGIDGTHRFLKRIWSFIYANTDVIKDINFNLNNDSNNEPNNAINWQECPDILKKVRSNIHQILKQALRDYERKQYNTVASACMKLFNELNDYQIKTDEDKYLIHEGVSILLRILAPIAPHICHHLWQELGFDDVIINAPFPRVDKNALKTNSVQYIVQVNGKKRAEFAAPIETTEKDLIKTATENCANFIGDKPLKKAVVVANRQLINLVI